MNKAHKSVTIHDIAREAGVSIATVSRAINNKLLVSTGTYEKVLAAMNKLGYQTPQPSAAVKPDMNNRVVIVNIPTLGNSVHTDFMEGINASAAKYNWRVLITTDKITTENQENVLRTIQSCRAVGMICMNITDTDSLKYLSTQIPLVQCMEFDPDLNIPYIAVDDYAAAFSAVEYLISTGRRNIGMFRSFDMLNSRKRYRGFRDALAKHGLKLDPSLDVQVDNMRTNSMRAQFRAAINNFKSVPDAFFCTSDQAAQAALYALVDFGYRVPEDIALMGYDDSDIAELCLPKLSTVGYSKYDAGFIACDMLHELFMNPFAMIRSSLLDTRLVIRQST